MAVYYYHHHMMWCDLARRIPAHNQRPELHNITNFIGHMYCPQVLECMREQPTRESTDVIVTNNNSRNPLILIRACQKLRGQYRMIFQIVILRAALDCVCITMKYLQRTCHVWINGDVIYCWLFLYLFYLLSIYNPLWSYSFGFVSSL